MPTTRWPAKPGESPRAAPVSPRRAERQLQRQGQQVFNQVHLGALRRWQAPARVLLATRPSKKAAARAARTPSGT